MLAVQTAPRDMSVGLERQFAQYVLRGKIALIPLKTWQVCRTVLLELSAEKVMQAVQTAPLAMSVE